MWPRGPAGGRRVPTRCPSLPAWSAARPAALRPRFHVNKGDLLSRTHVCRQTRHAGRARLSAGEGEGLTRGCHVTEVGLGTGTATSWDSGHPLHLLSSTGPHGCRTAAQPRTSRPGPPALPVPRMFPGALHRTPPSAEQSLGLRLGARSSQGTAGLAGKLQDEAGAGWVPDGPPSPAEPQRRAEGCVWPFLPVSWVTSGRMRPCLLLAHRPVVGGRSPEEPQPQRRGVGLSPAGSPVSLVGGGAAAHVADQGPDPRGQEPCPSTCWRGQEVGAGGQGTCTVTGSALHRNSVLVTSGTPTLRSNVPRGALLPAAAVRARPSRPRVCATGLFRDRDSRAMAVGPGQGPSLPLGAWSRRGAPADPPSPSAAKRVHGGNRGGPVTAVTQKRSVSVPTAADLKASGRNYSRLWNPFSQTSAAMNWVFLLNWGWEPEKRDTTGPPCRRGRPGGPEHGRLVTGHQRHGNCPSRGRERARGDAARGSQTPGLTCSVASPTARPCSLGEGTVCSCEAAGRPRMAGASPGRDPGGDALPTAGHLPRPGHSPTRERPAERAGPRSRVRLASSSQPETGGSPPAPQKQEGPGTRPAK